MHAVGRVVVGVLAGVVLVGAGAACSVRTDDLPAAPATPSGAAAPPSAAPSPTASVVRRPAPAPVEPDVPPSGAPVREPELRAELLAMLEEDQAVRTGVAPPGDDRTADELAAAWDATDDRHAARMTEILDAHGWPGWRLVGGDGAFAAFILIQHADLEPDLQERGLALLGAAVEAGDADPSDHAYLVDRVRVARGEPQVYATQWETGPDGELRPRTPIEDEAGVDVRRAAVGLGTVDDYLVELEAAS